MTNHKTFKISNSTVRGARISSDGTSPFDQTPVVLENLDVANEMIEVREWGDVFVAGEPIAKENWDVSLRTGSAIALPPTSPLLNPVMWVLRANFPDRSLLINEAKQITIREKRIPGRMGEQVALLVGGEKGSMLLSAWHDRLVRTGLDEFGDQNFAEAKSYFAAALAVKLVDARDVFRLVIADITTEDHGNDARVTIYANLARKWGKRNGGRARLTELLENVCREMGVESVLPELAERLLGKVSL